ncbi:unnamed protein product [Mytilus coruscus]|uniref:Uncharacterized protein n=1 Tax=Mytilus coruscus TaxID=42192 RepID=A0A6J8ERH6_MYTCO|nr:unnamed protein product [Mytilus coruscus]
MKKIECLDETLKITRQCIKSYVSSSVNSSELPDIRCFDVHDEIQKLDPVLWNFIYRLTANEIEEKELRRHVFYSWENSYLGMDDSCFTVASFDNLDKNQKYAIVGNGANKSGFHGTTIQAVTPKPSVKHDFTDVPKPSEPSYSDQSASETSIKSVSRSIPSDLIKALKEPEDNIGEPSNIKVNRFTRLSLDDFSISEGEQVAWDKHVQTEVSEFHSIAVLDETADSKATVELTLNILYDKFQVGTKINYLVVVGDGKSYDILIKLKSEYGNALD